MDDYLSLGELRFDVLLTQEKNPGVGDILENSNDWNNPTKLLPRRFCKYCGLCHLFQKILKHKKSRRIAGLFFSTNDFIFVRFARPSRAIKHLSNRLESCQL